MDKPEIPQRAPYVLEVEPGTYAWCACGRSQKQPFCDGSHASTDLRPRVEKVAEKKTLAWCGCKHSANAPFCDGTHATL